MADDTITPAGDDVEPAKTPRAGRGGRGSRAAAPVQPAIAADQVDQNDTEGRIAELERLLAEAQAIKDAQAAELAAIRSGNATFTPGQRYKVSVKDGPTAVVEPNPGEHPHDAFKRVTGVQSSIHPFDFHPTHEEPGLIRHAS